jgi:NAD(P)-dependent dehydrogenase (short-subunit alcohol dehydrogenase family)
MELGTGTVAVVTGAGSGIGRSLATAFGSAGCSVVLADVQRDALTAAEAELAAGGAPTMSVVTDVSKREQVDALAAATMERFGAVHVVCNNAGVASKAEPWAGSLEAWEWTMGVNFWGVVYGVRAFLPHIAASGGGHIVNTASIAGLMPGFGAPYDASKHAVVAITEGLFNSLALSPVPIGVSCLCPGWVRTGIFDADRNWPTELGEAPPDDEVRTVQATYIRRALDEGMPPAAVADLVVDAVRVNRFWVFPHPEFVDLAVRRFHTIADGLDPSMPEQVPGMPPTEQIMAETIAALFPDVGAGA